MNNKVYRLDVSSPLIPGDEEFIITDSCDEEGGEAQESIEDAKDTNYNQNEYQKLLNIFSELAVALNEKPEKTASRRLHPEDKVLLTLEEAAELTGIGINKLRSMSNEEDCSFVLWNGTKRMFKRKKLEAFLEAAYSI